MNPRIYLCGPMAENTPEQAGGWRLDAAAVLKSVGFKTSSPMREKEMLKKGQRMGVNYKTYGDVPELTASSIFTRDQFDVRHADLVLANMTELGKGFRRDRVFKDTPIQIPSIGSDFEIAWAFMLNTPVVLIAPDGNPYAEHPFLAGMSSLIRFAEMNEGIAWIIKNFSIYLEEKWIKLSESEKEFKL